MFKSAKRRSEKSKIKAVFQLQFQATQVPQVKAKALTVSLVPMDVGKPTVRLEKAAIVDGTCFWKNPVYETVKFIRDPKTRRFKEKYYHFIVSTGSSKAGLLGEVPINFADYADAAKPSTVSLPLNTLNHGGAGAILHVTIHNMQDSVDLREADETPTAESQDRSLKNQLRNLDRNGNSNLSLTEDGYINKLALEISEDTWNFRDLLEEDPMILQDDTTSRQDYVPKKRTTGAFPENGYVHQRSNTDWSKGSALDGSMVDIPNSPEENLLRDRWPETSIRSDEKLIRKISMLERQAELSELELQSLRKQIVKESKRGQDLSIQISRLKEERNTMETEYEQLKSREVSNQLQIKTEKLKVKLEEMRQELNHEKDLGETLRLQLQKTEDSSSELANAVKELDEILEQKDREIADLSAIIKANKNDKDDPNDVPLCTNKFDEVEMLKQEITDLNGELEVYRKDREELMMHMDQLAVEYDILKQENHDFSMQIKEHEMEKVKMQNECSELSSNVKEFELKMERLEKEMKEKSQELTESSQSINKLETQAESLEKKLEKQAQGFEDDLEGITLLKIELEQRAIRAEEALRKTMSTNAVGAERIQGEFRRLSVEMTSKLDDSEKMAMKAVAEANDLRTQKRVVEEILKKANEELILMKEQYEEKLQELLNQIIMEVKQIEQMSLELEEKDAKIKNLEAEKRKKRREESDGMAMRKTSVSEQQMLQTWSQERELKKEYSSARKEAQKLQEESNTLRSLKDENESMVRILQSDIEKLRFQYSELKHSLFEVELEKENLKKEVFKLEGDLQKKEEAIISTEKKLQNDIKQARNRYTEPISSKCGKSAKDVVSEKLNLVELTMLNLRLPGKSSTAGTDKENGDPTAPVIRGIETFSDKGLNVSSFTTSDEYYLTQLVSEITLLKERNTSMEGELKEMQERYSEISLNFAEVEGERQQLVMTVRNLKNTKKN